MPGGSNVKEQEWVPEKYKSLFYLYVNDVNCFNGFSFWLRELRGR